MKTIARALNKLNSPFIAQKDRRPRSEKKKKKNELENALHEKADIIWSKFRYASNFYNAVIRSIIMFVSVCWGGGGIFQN